MDGAFTVVGPEPVRTCEPAAFDNNQVPISMPISQNGMSMAPIAEIASSDCS